MNRLWIWLAGIFLVNLIISTSLSFFFLYEVVYNYQTVGNSLQEDLERDTSLRNEIIDYYQTQQSWDGIAPFLAQNEVRRNSELYWTYEDISFTLVDNSGSFLYQTAGFTQPGAKWEIIYSEPVMIDGQKQAQIIFYDTETMLANTGFYAEAAEEYWKREQLYYFGVWATVSLLVASVFGFILARFIKEITHDVEQFAKRNFSHRLKERGSREIRQIARSINSMAASLEKQDELRSNMLADVTHELRTPLAVLQGNLRAILDGVYKLDYNEILHVYDQTRLLTRLVNDLHQLAQAEAQVLRLDRNTVLIKEIVENTVGAFSPLAEEDQITIRVLLDENTPPLSLDRERITQVLHNLLGNALRHTPAGGNIIIRTQSDRQDFHLVVEDTGEGIPEESLPYIFDRFYRIDKERARSKGGTGLGLAISRAIIEAHGGKISARNVNPGARFTLQIPLKA